ncbi:hypothetical protein [Dolichospermum flos-aquae]|uniref:Uncharacterized protein n=1 Tax=Dolichospermum flos-aquae LEGE 04289 TaxID=1828708 RepID=A0ACC5Q3Z0_DOLFA|nr:hypothetical protein [Dolichospermum flos-aquae]MBE9219649.1 hypothetical protein [Dolichospermum flos-aquae LEGE 04289]
MAITSQIKDILNYFLNKVNLNIETLTAEKLEALRLKKIEKMGNFELPVFPIPDSFNSHQAEIFSHYFVLKYHTHSGKAINFCNFKKGDTLQ